MTEHAGYPYGTKVLRGAGGAWPGARFASISAPLPGSARPTPCWAKGCAGCTGAPTWWWGSSRPTPDRTPRSRSRICRFFRARRCATATPSSRSWISRRSWPAGPNSFSSTNSHTPTCPAPGRTTSAGRTSRFSSRPASTCSRRSTSSTWNRSTTWSSRSPASTSARPCPTRSSGPPNRCSWWTPPPRRCAGGWRTATSTRPRRSTPRWRTTSARATSPPCASLPCCGWPIASRKACSATANSTASPPPGKPANGWWSASPAARRARR